MRHSQRSISPLRRSLGIRLALMVPLGLALPVSGQATPLPPACATVHQSVQAGADGHVVLEHVTMTMAAGGGVFQAGRIDFSGPGGNSDGARDLADAASLVLLASLGGHHEAACTGWLEAEGRDARDAVAHGAPLGVGWNNASIHRASMSIALRAAGFDLTPADGGNAEAKLMLDGIATHGVQNAELLPETLHADFTMPQSELAALMASVGGKAQSMPTAHVIIRSLDAQRDTVRLAGHGEATLTGSVDATSASGHLEVTNLEGLIDAARNAGEQKLAAGLVIARLVSHHHHSETNSWDANWVGGVLTVNGVPLPLK